MDAFTQPVIEVTEAARDKALYIRARDEEPGRLALWLQVSGVKEGRYDVAMTLDLLSDAGPNDLIQWHDDLPVVVPAESVEKLHGATLDREGDLETGGLRLHNPNTPPQPASPSIPSGPPPDLSGPIPQRVLQVLESQINPSIAAHGGRAELVAVEDGTAYLRLGGGCQGCGMAKVTLSQGIEVALREAVPEITSVVDVTDHEAGTNPYFEAAKK